MATREVKHNWEQRNVITTAGATIVVVSLEHRERKLSAGSCRIAIHSFLI